MMIRYYYLLIYIYISSLWNLSTRSLAHLVVINEEYCEHETFAPVCADYEVVLVTSASYGRLRTGKCIPEKYASELGCSTDVLNFINHKCSGRQSCSFHVSNFVEQLETDCPASVIRSYFEVSYTCLKVLTPSMNKCQDQSLLSANQVDFEAYISSYFTHKSGCGDTDNPWILTADVGQRINITLIDFASIAASSKDKDAFQCDVYATIRDRSGTVTSTVCGGQDKKVVPVFMSTSNSVEIRLIGKSVQQANSEGQFLLKYTIEGCSDPDLPDNMWLKHFGHEVLVGCKTGVQTTWLLKCVRGTWEGQVGICSSGSASVLGPIGLPSKNKELFQNVAMSKTEYHVSTLKPDGDTWSAILSKDANIILLSGTVIVISVIFFTLGVICIWSKYSKRNLRRPVHVDQLTYGCKEFSYTRPLPPSYEMYPATTRNTLPSTVQTAVYPFSEASSTYNTVSNRQSTRDHIYERTFAPNVASSTDDVPCDDTMSEHKYFVLDPKYTSFT